MNLYVNIDKRLKKDTRIYNFLEKRHIILI